MIERVLNDFDIDQIASSGQCFRFHRVGDKSYDLIAGTHLLNIQQNGQTVRFDCDEDEFNAIWRPYFDLDADYGRCKAELPNAISICRTPLHTAADCVFCGRICGKLFYALSSRSRTISRGLPSVSKICVPFSGKSVIIRVNRYTIAFPRQSVWRCARPRTLRRCGSATAPNTFALRPGRSRPVRSIWKLSGTWITPAPKPNCCAASIE